MPLHLLGKKSWNVYNQDNISRVRRDEAAAEAREAAEEQSMQEADARRRMRLLRGESAEEEPPPTRKRSTSPVAKTGNSERLGLDTTYGDRDRKRKRLRGEDDTDRDMRFAKRMVEDRPKDDERRVVRAKKIEDGTELVDRAGHINLFPAEAKVASREEFRAARAKKEKSSKKEREPDQEPVMRLSDAAGRSRGEREDPWYSSKKLTALDDHRAERVRKDVWGNDDPNRKARDQVRMAANDPLAAMMAGVKQVRKVEADRKKWKLERDAEIRSLREDERRRHRRRERNRGDRPNRDKDELESFSLDDKGDRSRHERHHDGHASRHRHHRHSRSDRDRRSWQEQGGWSEVSAHQSPQIPSLVPS